MKITEFEFITVESLLKNPYTIAYETIEKVTNIFIRIGSGASLCGYGCAAPDPAVTAETAASVLNSLNEIVLPEIIGCDPYRPASLMESLKTKLDHAPAVLAAVDMALYDLLAKKCALPLWKFLGGYRSKIMSSITIGIMSTRDTVKLAEEYIRQGYKSLKIKGGKNLDGDIEKMLALRKTVGRQVELRFDANQGYNVAQSLKFVHDTKPAHIILLEQPTPRDQPELLGQIKKNISIPLMADESLMNLADAFLLARENLVDLLNIKLMKVGGITEALKINALAQAAGIGVMVGCMDESALAISAGLHFALSSSNVAYADLDGHLDLIDDPAGDCFKIRNGYLIPNDIAGLGYRKNPF
jgi:L-alanine-DL-glutamate epimerase-like enolase superfamily enzyme